MLTRWKRNRFPVVPRNVRKFCWLVSPRKKRLLRWVVHVTRLPLVETHRLQTVQCIWHNFCQQLVQWQLLLYDLQRSRMKQPSWRRLWHPMPKVYLRSMEYECNHQLLTGFCIQCGRYRNDCISSSCVAAVRSKTSTPSQWSHVTNKLTDRLLSASSRKTTLRLLRLKY